MGGVIYLSLSFLGMSNMVSRGCRGGGEGVDKSRKGLKGFEH